MEKLGWFFNNFLKNRNFVCFVFGLHSCGLGWLRVIVLWVGLGTGYSLEGWVGHGFNIILSIGSGWVRVE